MTKRTAYLWGICLFLGIINHFFVSGRARFILPFVLAPALLLYWAISLNHFSEAIRAYDPYLYHVFRDRYQGHFIKFAKEIVRTTCPNRFHGPRINNVKAGIKVECRNEKILNYAKTVLEFYESGILLYAIVITLSV